MADIKKFLNQDGVSVLWSRIAEEESVANAFLLNMKLVLLLQKAKALEKGTYDDTEFELIPTTKIGVLCTMVLVVLCKLQMLLLLQKLLPLRANFDTLKEIADWILNDTTGAADMAKISLLQNGWNERC